MVYFKWGCRSSRLKVYSVGYILTSIYILLRTNIKGSNFRRRNVRSKSSYVNFLTTYELLDP
ncbi:hypothetical protein UT300007_13550 [Clostridium sp. CTA-7]